MIVLEIFPYAHVVYNVFSILYILTIIVTIGVIVGENRNPVKSLAWVTVLILLPVAGCILYLLFGRSLKGMRMISRRNRKRLRARHHFAPVNIDRLPLSDTNRQLVRLVNKLVEPHYFAHNHIDIFTQGQPKFDQLKADLAAAREYIDLQYYIFEDDAIGREICDILVAKAREGVTVRVIYDHLGSYTFNSSFFARMRRDGVEAYPFLKVTLTEFANRLNWRNHRKLVIIDGKVGYVGGMNIADRYVTGDNGNRPWRDTHLRITGEAVSALQYVYAIDWNFMGRPLPVEDTTALPLEASDTDGVQIVGSGPNGRWSNIALVFIHAISNARERVWIQTPYFLPNDALLKVLQTAALSRVDVRVMLPRRCDSRLLGLASASYIKECILAGIKVYFYDPAMLHSKVVIVDDDFVTTGSTNFDFRSFEHNFECNALVYGKAFNARMCAIFESDQSQCERVHLTRWRRRPLWRKALESIVRLLSPIL